MVSQHSTDTAEQAVLVRAAASTVGLGEGEFRFLRFDEEFLRCATRVRELNDGLWLVSMWDMRPESREELRIRVENWDDRSVRWTFL